MRVFFLQITIVVITLRTSSAQPKGKPFSSYSDSYDPYAFYDSFNFGLKGADSHGKHHSGGDSKHGDDHKSKKEYSHYEHHPSFGSDKKDEEGAASFHGFKDDNHKKHGSSYDNVSGYKSSYGGGSGEGFKYSGKSGHDNSGGSSFNKAGSYFDDYEFHLGDHGNEYYGHEDHVAAKDGHNKAHKEGGGHKGGKHGKKGSFKDFGSHHKNQGHKDIHGKKVSYGKHDHYDKGGKYGTHDKEDHSKAHHDGHKHGKHTKGSQDSDHHSDGYGFGGGHHSHKGHDSNHGHHEKHHSHHHHDKHDKRKNHGDKSHGHHHDDYHGSGHDNSHHDGHEDYHAKASHQNVHSHGKQHKQDGDSYSGKQDDVKHNDNYQDHHNDHNTHGYSGHESTHDKYSGNHEKPNNQKIYNGHQSHPYTSYDSSDSSKKNVPNIYDSADKAKSPSIEVVHVHSQSLSPNNDQKIYSEKKEPIKHSLKEFLESPVVKENSETKFKPSHRRIPIKIIHENSSERNEKGQGNHRYGESQAGVKTPPIYYPKPVKYNPLSHSLDDELRKSYPHDIKDQNKPYNSLSSGKNSYALPVKSIKPVNKFQPYTSTLNNPHTEEPHYKKSIPNYLKHKQTVSSENNYPSKDQSKLFQSSNNQGTENDDKKAHSPLTKNLNLSYDLKTTNSKSVYSPDNFRPSTKKKTDNPPGENLDHNYHPKTTHSKSEVYSPDNFRPSTRKKSVTPPEKNLDHEYHPKTTHSKSEVYVPDDSPKLSKPKNLLPIKTIVNPNGYETSHDSGYVHFHMGT